MANGDKPKPARVPNAAPKILKDFVRCNQDEITLDATKVDWMPTGPFGDFAPSPTVGAGSSPNTATLGYGTLEFPSSIGADGQLVVDTSSVPSDGIFSFLGDAIQEWVKAFNETMKANEKGLEHLEVKGTKITLTKETVGAAPDETAVTAPPTAIPVPAPKETEPSPESEAEEKPDDGGCKWPFLGILFVLLLVVAAIVLGAVALFRGGGSDDDVVATDAAAEETTAEESALNTVPEPEITEDVEAPAGAGTDEEPVVEEPPAPPYQVDGELWQIDLDEGEAWDVATREAQGPFTFGGTVELFVRDQPVNGGFPWMAHVTPLSQGAFELWLFDDETSEQTGSTPFLGDSFATFGAGQGEGSSHPCGDGALFFGTSQGDPRLRSSWGVTIYVPLDSDQGFDDGITGAVGDFLGGIPGSPVLFDVDPGDRTIRGDVWESPTNGCLNDPDIGDDIFGADFFSAGGGSGQLGVLQGDAAFPDLDLGGVRGEVVAATLDDRADTVDCADNVTPLDNLGSDIFGLIVFRDGDTVNVAVVMAESPLVTRQDDWSSSVNLQTVSEGGVQHFYINEFHNGTAAAGELVDGTIDPGGVETRLTDDAVIFTFPTDPNDPLGLAGALSLDTPDEGDSKACDDVIGDIGIFTDGFESGDTSAWSTGR
jgi:hypothetical protein